MRDPAGVAAARDRGGELGGNAEPSRGFRQQHHAAVRGDPPAVERGDDFLAPGGWKRERQGRSVGHGGCGTPGWCRRTGFSNQIQRHINRLRYIRQPLTRGAMNKTG
jgi:hypothetical protein